MQQKMKYLLKICLFMFFLCSSILPVSSAKVQAQEAQPVKITIMPIVGYTADYPDNEKYIYSSLKRALHVPLNGVLQKVQYLDPDKTAAMADELSGYGTNILSKDGMAQLAMGTGADVLIGIKADFMRQEMRYYFDESYLYSAVGLKIFIYDKRTDEYKVYKDYKSYDGTYSTQGTVYVLTQEVMDSLLKKADLKKYID